MDEIKDMGGGVYVINGKAVKPHPEAMDLSTPEGRVELVRIADELYTGQFDKPTYGVLNVCVIMPMFNGPSGPGYGLSYMHMHDLCDEARSNLRKEFPDHAGEI